MQGPEQVFYGSVEGASTANAEAIDAHTAALADHDATLAEHAATIAANQTATNTAIAAINSVPSGLIAAFQNAASIAPGWSRFTSGDGKYLIGAGTSFSQTFTEGASAGSTWQHLHGVTTGSQNTNNNSPASGSVSSGGGSTAVPTHTHPWSWTGNTDNQTWIPPSFTIVWAKKD